MTRAERASEAARLKAEGLNGIEIAERMGLSRSYAYELLNDPSGSGARARKDSYRGTCEVCGVATDGGGGPSNAPKRCPQHPETTWTRELVIEKVREWAALYGKPPTAIDWNGSALLDKGEDERAARYFDGGWPSQSVVQMYCGSFNEAIRTAGFEPNRALNGGVGHGPGSVTDQDLERTVALVEEHGLDGAARLLGMTKQGVKVRLRKTDRKELVVMGARLSPADVMRREIERLNREIEEAEERTKEKRASIAQYEKAIKVLSSTNGAAAKS